MLVDEEDEENIVNEDIVVEPVKRGDGTSLIWKPTLDAVMKAPRA